MRLFSKILVMSMLIVPMVVVGQTSKLEKQLAKAKAKQAKEQIRKYEKEGWQVDGTTKSVKVALMEHYLKLEDPKNREIVGSVTNCESRNVCQNFALNNAIVKYANEAKSFVKGRVDSEVGSVGDQELDNFYSAYERLVAAEINGELELSVSLYRQDKDGKKEYDAFFIVNEEKASKKRIKAMENALKESQAAQKWGAKISDFVNEAFEVNQ